MDCTESEYVSRYEKSRDRFQRVIDKAFDLMANFQDACLQQMSEVEQQYSYKLTDDEEE